MKRRLQLVSYSLCPCVTKFWRISPLISLLDFILLMALILFLRWLTGLANTAIFLLYLILLLLKQCLEFFERKLSGCMVYLAPFFWIMMLSSQVPFGRNFFALVALVSVWVLHIIHNLMVKRRWSINALKLKLFCS